MVANGLGSAAVRIRLTSDTLLGESGADGRVVGTVGGLDAAHAGLDCGIANGRVAVAIGV